MESSIDSDSEEGNRSGENEGKASSDKKELNFQVNEATLILFLCGNLASVIDKHAPFRKKRVKNKRSPWITNELLHEIHKRFSKKQSYIYNYWPFDLETV